MNKSTAHIGKSTFLALSGQCKASKEIPELTQLSNLYLRKSAYSNALKISAQLRHIFSGKQLHSHVIKLGYCNILSIENQILNVYVKCKEFQDAFQLFGTMPVRNVVTWNTVICGVATCGQNYNIDLHLVFMYFRRMLEGMVNPNYITFTGLLRACVEQNEIDMGKQIHCFLVKLSFDLNTIVGSALVDLYAKFGLVEYARSVFYEIQTKDLVLWNVMISCYSLNSLAKEAFKVFKLMQLEGIKGDDFTFTSLLSSCTTLGSCELGEQFHSIIIKRALDLDIFVASALIDMYTKHDYIEYAHEVFDKMSIRNVVSWTTIIVGYGRNGDGKKAMKLFNEMLQEGFKPDELTLASITSSSGSLSSTAEVIQVHSYIIKCGFQAHLSTVNSLVTAYSKCGSISNASQCFSSVLEPDIVTWTSIIGAYAFHGLAKEAIECFQEMLISGVRPDRIAFLSIITACSHGGLIKEGLYYFNLMTCEYKFVPDLEHYTCLIDLFARAGLLDEAFDILSLLHIEEVGSKTLGAFIGACKVYGNVELASWAGEKLFLLEPTRHVNYTLLSNMYASFGNWVEVARARRMMRERCNLKVPGCSWMEIAGEVHSFVSSDRSHPQDFELYAMVVILVKVMKEEELMC